MSIWTSIKSDGPDITAGNGVPGDEPLHVDVAIAPNWNNRTRISAWNNEVGIEVLVDPANLDKLIAQLLLAQGEISDAMAMGPDPELTPAAPERSFEEIQLEAAMTDLAIEPPPCVTVDHDRPIEEIPPGAHENRFGKWCYCSEPNSPAHTA